MSLDLDAVKRKVRGLLAVAAEKSGATDQERITAARLAAQLLAAHNLREADVHAPAAARAPHVTITVFGFGGAVNTATSTGWHWSFRTRPGGA